ncbi:hypothetical protein [Nocardioides pacificus]
MGQIDKAMNAIAARESQKQTKLLKKQNQMMRSQPPQAGPATPEAAVAHQTLAMLTNIANELVAIRTLLEQRLPAPRE